MGCMYAEGGLDKCKCTCKGSLHGLMSETLVVAAFCSPAVEKRCKAGLEGGACRCACEGINHGLYHGIEGFEKVRIIGLDNRYQR